MSDNAKDGFTLLELLVCLTILGIVLGIGIPNLASFKAKIESDSVKASIRRMLSTARSHAISREMDTTICGINSDNECIKNNFMELAIFVDNNTNKIIDDDEKIIANTGLEYRGTLSLKASLGREFVQFRKTGSAKQAGSFIYCDPHHPRAATRITVSMSGRAYTARDLDRDGIVETSAGDPIQC